MPIRLVDIACHYVVVGIYEEDSFVSEGPSLNPKTGTGISTMAIARIGDFEILDWRLCINMEVDEVGGFLYFLDRLMTIFDDVMSLYFDLI